MLHVLVDSGWRVSTEFYEDAVSANRASMSLDSPDALRELRYHSETHRNVMNQVSSTLQAIAWETHPIGALRSSNNSFIRRRENVRDGVAA